MSTADIVAPEVRLFLARVRHELADLDPSEVEEITDGLEADLAELIEERGTGALGSPVEYAAELRAAAGLGVGVRPAGHGRRQRAGVAVTAFLDGAHARFDALVALLPGDQRPLLAWLRPLWWIVRGWLGVQMLDWGYHSFVPAPQPLTLIPHLRGLGIVLVMLAVLLSIQIGRGRVWPGNRHRSQSRVALLAVNLAAIIAVPIFLSGYDANGGAYAYDDAAFSSTSPLAGLYADGDQVTNIYPYDASGKPLVGVQLFDQDGRPIDVPATAVCHLDGEAGWRSPGPNQGCFDPETGSVGGTPLWRVFYPWTNGATEVKNVFPMPSRMQQDRQRSTTAFAESDPPRTGAFPQASVPPVSLPGIVASLQKVATAGK
jgi:hypothetical protein